jgi:hypothetical protein
MLAMILDVRETEAPLMAPAPPPRKAPPPRLGGGEALR